MAGFLNIRTIKFLTFAHPFHIKRDLVFSLSAATPFSSLNSVLSCILSILLPSFRVCELNIISYPHNNFIYYRVFLLSYLKKSVTLFLQYTKYSEKFVKFLLSNKTRLPLCLTYQKPDFLQKFLFKVQYTFVG